MITLSTLSVIIGTQPRKATGSDPLALKTALVRQLLIFGGTRSFCTILTVQVHVLVNLEVSKKTANG